MDNRQHSSSSLPLLKRFDRRCFSFRIADINQSLIDDGLVDKEKIGGSNYFWSFPAKKDAAMQVKHQETLKRIESLQAAVTEANARLIDAKRGREEDEDDIAQVKTEKDGDVIMAEPEAAEKGDGTGEGGESGPAKVAMEMDAVTTKPKGSSRAFKLQRLQEIATERKKLEAELESLKENDPQALADLEKELKLVTEAANRWTDNIFNCKTYLTKKRGMDRKDANKILGITDNFDCKYRLCSGIVPPTTVAHHHLICRQTQKIRSQSRWIGSLTIVITKDGDLNILAKAPLVLVGTRHSRQ